MAVYTHFGGIHALLAEVATEAFARFGAVLGAIALSDDPVADLFTLGAAYRDYALANRQRYCLMFGLTAHHIARRRALCDVTESAPFAAIGAGTFEHIVTVVERVITGGHIRRDSPGQVAARLWALLHGAVLLELTGAPGSEGRSPATILIPATIDILVGMGANRSQVERSAQTV